MKIMRLVYEKGKRKETKRMMNGDTGLEAVSNYMKLMYASNCNAGQYVVEEHFEVNVSVSDVMAVKLKYDAPYLGQITQYMGADGLPVEEKEEDVQLPDFGKS